MRPRIRVAYVLTPITFGGAEQVSLNFLSNVDQNQIDLHLIALVRPWEESPWLLEEAQRLGFAYTTLPTRVRRGVDPLRIVRVSWRLYLIFRQQRFDLAHTHGYFADICALPIARLCRIPGLSTCHGFINSNWRLQVYNRVDIWALRLCRRVLAVSNGIRDGLEERGVKKERIRVITNAVPIPPSATKDDADRRCIRLKHGISHGEFVFAYVGRLSEEKGLHYLLDAFSGLILSGTNARLVLIGDGPQRRMLKQRVAELDLERQVLFTGFQKQISPWLAISDCFVLPSLTEGTPMVLLEAMAMKVPIVATGVGGVPDVIADGVNGLLVPCANVEALRDAISRIIADPELREKFRREARKTVKSRYSVQPWCQKIQRNYQDLCPAYRHRA